MSWQVFHEISRDLQAGREHHDHTDRGDIARHEAPQREGRVAHVELAAHLVTAHEPADEDDVEDEEE